jgi:preprotein translocase subunit SecG
MPILLYSLLAIHVIMCALMILVTLMQRPRSEGLGAAFGGGMTDNVFGAQTTNVLAKFTTWLGGLFFVVTLVLAMLYARTGTGGETKIQQELKNLPAPSAETAPEATPVNSLVIPPVATPE